MRRILLAAVVAGTVVSGLVDLGGAAQAAPASRSVRVGAETDPTYTVWYRYPGQRWTGISGLSYYDACSARDAIIDRGGQSYVAQDGARD